MKILLFYDQQDRPIVHQLLSLLESAITAGKISVVTPEHLNTGKPLHDEVENLLTDCAIFVPFVSAQMFTLPAYQMIEPEVLDRLKKDEIRVYPVLARHCLYEYSELAKLNLQTIPLQTNWLSETSDKDKAYNLEAFSKVLIDLSESTSQRLDELSKTINEIKKKSGLEDADLNHLEKELKNIIKSRNAGTISSASLFIKVDLLFKSHNAFIQNFNAAANNSNDPELTGILYLYANPTGKAPALFEREQKQIDNVLDAYKDTKFVKRSQVEAFKLLKELMMNPSTVVHLAIHGTRKGELLFVDAEGEADGITVDRLFKIFEQLKTKNLLPDLLLINACHSKGHAEKLAEIVEFAIGIDGSFPVTAAVKFAEIFYLNYLTGATFQYSFNEAVLAIEKLEIADIDGKKVHEMPHFFNHIKT